MTGSEAWRAVLNLAEEQWGLVTKQQIEATGVAWSTLSRQIGSGALERVAHGIYRIRGGGTPGYLDLRAAWLQLAPATPAWERSPEQGVVSHRSAALLYGLGDLPADIHEFTLPVRRQTRRADVRLHRLDLDPTLVDNHRGLLTTKPARIAATSWRTARNRHRRPGLWRHPRASESPRRVAAAVAAHASALGFARGDGLRLLRWLLELSGDPNRDQWLEEAAA